MTTTNTCTLTADGYLNALAAFLLRPPPNSRQKRDPVYRDWYREDLHRAEGRVRAFAEALGRNYDDDAQTMRVAMGTALVRSAGDVTLPDWLRDRVRYAVETAETAADTA